MISTKRHKHRDESSTQSPSSSNKLFVDYPYPILTKLDKTYTTQKPSDHHYTLVSLRWYKGCFHKMIGLLHSLPSHGSSTSIIEESFRQAHIDEHSSQAIVDSMSPPINDQAKQNKKQPVRKINMAKLNTSIALDPG